MADKKGEKARSLAALHGDRGGRGERRGEGNFKFEIGEGEGGREGRRVLPATGPQRREKPSVEKVAGGVSLKRQFVLQIGTPLADSTLDLLLACNSSAVSTRRF